MLPVYLTRLKSKSVHKSVIIKPEVYLILIHPGIRHPILAFYHYRRRYMRHPYNPRTFSTPGMMSCQKLALYIPNLK